MRNRRKKTWTDPVIDAANRAETPKERELRSILAGIYIIKDNPDLRPLYNGQDENIDSRLLHRAWAIQEIMHGTIRDLQRNYEPPELIWDYLTDKNKPRLRIISDPQKQMFSDLAQKLQDPEWVSALCQCVGCRNFLLSHSIWAKKGRKFCSPKCKEKYYGRKYKEKKKKESPNNIEVVECPANFEEITLTPTECINGNEKNIRGKFKHTCPTCSYNIKIYPEDKILTNIMFRLQTFKGQTVKLTPQEESDSSQEGEGPKIKKGGDD